MKSNEIELFNRLTTFVPQMSFVSINEYKRSVFLKDEEGRVLIEYSHRHDVVRFNHNVIVDVRDLCFILDVCEGASYVTLDFAP